MKQRSLPLAMFAFLWPLLTTHPSLAEPSDDLDQELPSTSLSARPNEAPRINHKPISTAAVGHHVKVSVKITDADGVAFPRLYYRRVGETTFQQVTLEGRSGVYQGTIPGSIVTENGLEYYIEAFDKAGNGPTYHGTPEYPHRVDGEQPRPSSSPAKPPPTPIYQRWWVWTAGLALLAGSVTAIVLSTQGTDTIAVQVTGPLPQPSTFNSP